MKKHIKILLITVLLFIVTGMVYMIANNLPGKKVRPLSESVLLVDSYLIEIEQTETGEIILASAKPAQRKTNMCSRQRKGEKYLSFNIYNDKEEKIYTCYLQRAYILASRVISIGEANTNARFENITPAVHQFINSLNVYIPFFKDAKRLEIENEKGILVYVIIIRY